MTIESQQDVEGLKRIGKVVATVLHTMLDTLEPGMTTAELDAVGAGLLDEHGARSAPQLAVDFPAATCISINEQAAHGVPGDRVIEPGNVVNIDVSAELDGYYADTGATRVMPPTTPLKTRLCHASKSALASAIKQARAGRPLRNIGRAIQKTAKAHRFRIIENLGSHGIGRSLHEDPHHIPGYYDPREHRKLSEGMVITIEPFLSTHSRHVTEEDDGWTLVGCPENLSAQYEHTLIITRGRPIVVTAH